MGVPPNSNRPWDYSARAVGSSANRARKVDAISDIRNANVWMIEKAKYAHRRARRPEHRAVLGLLGGEAHSLPLSAVPAQHEDKTTTTAITSNTLSVTSGGSITLTANIGTTSNSAQGPTGTVQFLNGGASLGSAATCTPKAANNNATPAVPASCTAQLTTTLSSLPPGFLGDSRPRQTPLVILTWLAAALALLSFLVAARMAAGRRRYAYAGAAFFLIAAATLAGCGGSSSSGGGGGGGAARTITAKYSGDANYGSSTSNSITITIE